MRFLITGASGFIGYPLTLCLAERYGRENIQLIIPRVDQHSKESKRRRCLEEAKFDIIIHDLLEDDLDIAKLKPFDILFHLAAYVKTETDSLRVHANDVGTKRLLNSLKPLLPRKRVVYTGSLMSVDRIRYDNTHQNEDYLCTPHTPYGRTKLEGELILRRQAEEIGFEWTILRLPTIYGPGFRSGGMFGLLTDGLRRGTLATRLAWPGRISLVYVADTVEILVALGTTDVGCNALYHINSGCNPKFDELIAHIARTLKLKRKRIVLPQIFWSFVIHMIQLTNLAVFLPYKLRIALWRISLVVIDGMVSDGAKLDQVLPFQYTPLNEGLAKTYGNGVDLNEGQVKEDQAIKCSFKDFSVF